MKKKEWQYLYKSLGTEFWLTVFSELFKVEVKKKPEIKQDYFKNIMHCSNDYWNDF